MEDRFRVDTPAAEASCIRKALRSHDGVKFHAYNREEVEAIKALLTEAEQARVRFSWWTWGRS